MAFHHIVVHLYDWKHYLDTFGIILALFSKKIILDLCLCCLLPDLLIISFIILCDYSLLKGIVFNTCLIVCAFLFQLSDDF